MKQTNFIFLFAMLMSLVVTKSFAHDIEVNNAEGKTIYYNYINNRTELEVTYIGDNFRSHDDRYTVNVVIPSEVTHNNKTYKVTSIGRSAFYDCLDLTSVTIPNSVTSVGDRAFYNCSGLTSVTIGNGVTSIGGFAFYNCSGLTSIAIPNSVTSIGDEAFRFCSGLTSIDIPNSVTSIGRLAFSECSGIISLTIPNSVISIGDLAFSSCTGLSSCKSEQVW